MGGLCPLFFDGAVCQFTELPRPDNKEEILKYYNYLSKLRDNNTAKSFFMYGISKMNKELHRQKLFHKFAALFK